MSHVCKINRLLTYNLLTYNLLTYNLLTYNPLTYNLLKYNLLFVYLGPRFFSRTRCRTCARSTGSSSPRAATPSLSGSAGAESKVSRGSRLTSPQWKCFRYNFLQVLNSGKRPMKPILGKWAYLEKLCRLTSPQWKFFRYQKIILNGLSIQGKTIDTETSHWHVGMSAYQS